MSSATRDSVFEWLGQQLCRDDFPGPIRGHLSENPRAEAALRQLLVFGPSACLLLGTPFRVSQLRGAKIVVRPNRRGYLKAVSLSQVQPIAMLALTCSSTARHCYALGLGTIPVCRRLPGPQKRTYGIFGDTLGLAGHGDSGLRPLFPRTRPERRTIHSFDRISCLDRLQRCHRGRPSVGGLELVQPMGSQVRKLCCQACPPASGVQDQEAHTP